MHFAPNLVCCLFVLRQFWARNRHFAPFSASIWSPTRDFSSPQKQLFTTKKAYFSQLFTPGRSKISSISMLL